MQVSQELEEAARLGGANWFQTVRHILLPLIKRGALYAWIVAFLSAFPELSASILLRNIGTDVVATAILDRILHHSTTINIKGNSYRLREKVKAGLIREPEVEES